MALQNVNQDATALLKIIVMSTKGIMFRDLLNQSGMLPEDMKRALSLLYDPKFIRYESSPTGGPKMYVATQEGIAFYQTGKEVPDKPSYSNDTSINNHRYLWVGKPENWNIKETTAYPSNFYKNISIRLEDAWVTLQGLVKDIDGVMAGELEAYIIQGEFIGKDADGKIKLLKPTKMEDVTGVIKGTQPPTAPHNPNTGLGHYAPMSQNNLARAFEDASTDGFEKFFETPGTSDMPWSELKDPGDDDSLPF